MRILVLGASGMLGHKLCQRLSLHHEVFATLRGQKTPFMRYGIIPGHRLRENTDVLSDPTLEAAFEAVKPDAVINAVGIIKQSKQAQDPFLSIATNSLLPHRLSRLCAARSCRLIHISTDCVFSGRKGKYREEDPSDAEDLYGRTKFLGELPQDQAHTLTLRTSIIGRELVTSFGLVEWFLSQGGEKTILGYTRAVYTGFTTIAFSDIIREVLEKHPHLQGLYQVASQPITKYDLLCMIRDVYDTNVDIIPSGEVVCDRSLNGSRFSSATGIEAKPWKTMVEEMRADPTPYEMWRKPI